MDDVFSRVANQFVFPVEALAATPSILAGFSAAEEAAARLSSTAFVDKLAHRLGRLPTETVAVAKVFLLRFGMRHVVAKDGQHIHPYVAGAISLLVPLTANAFIDSVLLLVVSWRQSATALFLACKSTDHYRKLTNVIYQCRYISFKGPEGVAMEFVQIPEFKDSDREYEKWYENIITTEELMTTALCFDFVVQLPHEVIPAILPLCFDGVRLEETEEESQICTQIYQKLRHHAYHYANECMSTTLPLRYNRNLLALIILRLAVEATKKAFLKTKPSARVVEFLESMLLAPSTDHTSPRTNMFYAHDLFDRIAKFRGAASYDGVLVGEGSLVGQDGDDFVKGLTGPALSKYLFDVGKEILLVSNRPKYEKYMQELLSPIIARIQAMKKLFTCLARKARSL
ncbi:UNVERIFIED_CONTAM: hypothetical protein HDU68_001671 [Siphonaria sp. JEL0065]|nr:hypothetical protein HDU68_001671 [Siphonaria sp. JEL0065]